MADESNAGNSEQMLDWESIHQRINTMNIALNDSDEIAPDVLATTWARRAKQLAQVPDERDDTDQLELALVQLGREIYGLNVLSVFDIKPAEHITRVPRVPKWVAGVTNLRGRIFSVVDLRLFFNLPEGDRKGNNETKVNPELVVIETPDMELAFLVDKVLAVEMFSAGQLQAFPGSNENIPTECVKGVIVREEEQTQADKRKKHMLITVLDIPTLLADKRLIIHEEVV